MTKAEQYEIEIAKDWNCEEKWDNIHALKGVYSVKVPTTIRMIVTFDDGSEYIEYAKENKKDPNSRELAIIKYIAENPGETSKLVIQNCGVWKTYNSKSMWRYYCIIQCAIKGWITTPDWEWGHSANMNGPRKHAWTITKYGLKAIERTR